MDIAICKDKIKQDVNKSAKPIKITGLRPMVSEREPVIGEKTAYIIFNTAYNKGIRYIKSIGMKSAARIIKKEISKLANSMTPKIIINFMNFLSILL